MKLSLFAHAKDAFPRHWECTWDEFCRDFGPHKLVDDTTNKERLPAFSPAEYPDGVRRSKDTVIRVHLLVLDIDEGSDEDLAAFLDRAEGLSALVCSTFSRGVKPGARARVIMPLSRPVRREEWPTFWELQHRLFDGIGDEHCSDPNRIYFGCFAPRSKADEAFFEVFDGQAFPVDELLTTPLAELPVLATAKRALVPVSEEQLLRMAKNLAKKDDDLGVALKKVCLGEIFAEPGNRDNTIFTLAGAIARRYPDGDSGMIASYFARSLDLMKRVDDDCPTVENVEYKIRRAQDSIRQTVVEGEQAKVSERRKRVQEAFRGARSEPYTAEELTAFNDPMWVVQHGGSYYFFVAGEYRGPYAETDAGNAALKLLAPAGEVVDLYRLTPRGEIQKKTANQLVAEYGTVADAVQLDLRAQKSTFDVNASVLTEAPCPRRQIAAVFHPEIDEWLRIAAGPQYEVLKTWMACVTNLSMPCVALFLTGAKDTGKSLIALGLSRFWTTDGPTTLVEAFSAFNENLARSPLCFADEQLPKDFKGYAKNGELREHIQARTRPYNRKYIPNTKLIGCTRTIIAANNEDILRTQENLSVNDIGAIVDRYLHIPMSPSAIEYLNRVDTSGWVDRDQIAEHAAWLRDNHVWKPEGRFLIKIKDEQLTRTYATQSGDRSAVCQWLVSYLLNPRVFHDDAKGRMLVQVNKGRLCVNTQGLVLCWELYVGNEKCPTTGRLSSALAALSVSGVRVKLNNELGSPTNYRVIDMANLSVWAKNNGYGTEEELLEALVEDTKTREQRTKAMVN